MPVGPSSGSSANRTAPAAALAAESGMTVFGIAYGQWIRVGERRPLADIAAEVFRELRSLTSNRVDTGSGTR